MDKESLKELGKKLLVRIVVSTVALRIGFFFLSVQGSFLEMFVIALGSALASLLPFGSIYISSVVMYVMIYYLSDTKWYPNPFVILAIGQGLALAALHFAFGQI